MGRALRWVGLGVGLLCLVATLGLGYVLLAYPIMPTPEAGAVAVDADKLARGAYLAEHVAVCVDCHSERDFSRFSAPVVDGTVGQGGQRFGHELGFPGELVAPNITPHALSSWSDGELIRAITTGVTPEGRALFPLMNYGAYGKLCRADVEALVTYVRSLAPVANTLPRSELDFPVNLIVRTLPKPVQLESDCPDAKDSVAYGKYLVNTAGCIDCHTRREGPDLNLALSFAGGVQMKLPGGGSVTSKNITPDPSGIGSWSRAQFIRRFATYRDPKNLHQVSAGDAQTFMPWNMYAGMSDQDLGAIYDFLRTVKPVKTDDPKIAQR